MAALFNATSPAPSQDNNLGRLLKWGGGESGDPRQRAEMTSHVRTQSSIHSADCDFYRSPRKVLRESGRQLCDHRGYAGNSQSPLESSCLASSFDMAIAPSILITNHTCTVSVSRFKPCI